MIEYFTTALSLARHALGLVKDAKDVLPDSKKPAVEAAIQQADQAFKIAEDRLRKSLVFTSVSAHGLRRSRFAVLAVHIVVPSAAVMLPRIFGPSRTRTSARANAHHVCDVHI
jgi:hypothetical protein